jgi:hypothetical protein
MLDRAGMVDREIILLVIKSEVYPKTGHEGPEGE